MLAVEIIVKGRIDRDWCDWLSGLSISDCGKDLSMLSGVVQDQAAVYRIIARMRDFGFQLSSVKIELIQKENDNIRGKDPGSLSGNTPYKCGKTFCARKGSIFYRLHTDA